VVAYYNEIEPYAAQWLRNLVAAGHIAPGDVDERSIVDVRPDDLKGYTQCHFFAGIGGWSVALRLAGWPDDRSVWTGSCPCQPFSAAGKRAAQSDERHLWPHWFRLIRECRPARIFGEQVAAAVAYGWLDDVANDLEAQGYAIGAAVLPACSVGAPHKRDRLWFVANANDDGQRLLQVRRSQNLEVKRTGESNAMANASSSEWRPPTEGRGNESDRTDAGRQEATSGYSIHRDFDVANPESGGWRKGDANAGGPPEEQGEIQERSGLADGNDFVGDSDKTRPQGWQLLPERADERTPWSAGVEYIGCSDGKARPVKPGIRLLAHGIPARVGRLRAYGNAIVPQVAAEFIKATDAITHASK
jgi:DNA (cytosine-5)-methyltransferase 1